MLITILPEPTDQISHLQMDTKSKQTTEENPEQLRFENAKNMRLYLQNYGIEDLRHALIERCTSIGIVSALMISMIFPIIVDPPETENENLLKAAESFLIICAAVCMFNISIATNNITTLSSFLESDEIFMKWLDKYLYKIGWMEKLSAIISLSVVSGTVIMSYAQYGLIVGIIAYIVLFSVGIFFTISQQTEVTYICSLYQQDWPRSVMYGILSGGVTNMIIVLVICIALTDDIEY